MPTRTARISAVSAVLATTLAILVGELVYLTWLIFREFHIFSPAAAIRVLPKYWLALDFNLFIRAGAAALGIVFAYSIARPETAKVRV